MDWIVQRYSDDGDSTLGLLFKVIGTPQGNRLHYVADTLEDEFREVKVGGETRIPAGRYELKIRKEETPLTLRHRTSYNRGFKMPWFKYHIEITGIPNFKYVYVHAGNTDDHTDGCLLLGLGSQNINGVQSINNSILACKAWYGEVYDELERGEKAWIEFRDETFLVK